MAKSNNTTDRESSPTSREDLRAEATKHIGRCWGWFAVSLVAVAVIGVLATEITGDDDWVEWAMLVAWAALVIGGLGLKAYEYVLTRGGLDKVAGATPSTLIAAGALPGELLGVLWFLVCIAFGLVMLVAAIVAVIALAVWVGPLWLIVLLLLAILFAIGRAK